MVATYYKVLWAHGNMVLEILLVFVEGEVLIQVLHIGSGLVGRLVAFRRIV